MIMPANYSAIAENELSYIDGGFVPAMTSVKTLEKNIVEWIGGYFAAPVMNAFIGQWFADDGKASILGNVFGAIGNLFTGEKSNGASININNQKGTAGKIFAGVRNAVGVLGAIYVLGMNDEAVKVDNAGIYTGWQNPVFSKK